MSTPEGKIQLEVLKYLRAKGIFCWRNNTMGVFDPKIGVYRKNPYTMKGVPDIICIIEGAFVGIEAKAPKKKQSADQVLFMKRLRAHGGVYHVVHSLADIRAIVG